jgi:hypothetical protein
VRLIRAQGIEKGISGYFPRLDRSTNPRPMSEYKKLPAGNIRLEAFWEIIYILSLRTVHTGPIDHFIGYFLAKVSPRRCTLFGMNVIGGSAKHS